MTIDRDILGAAQRLVASDGAGAQVVAAHRADDALASGDVDGAAVCKSIECAVETLLGVVPSASDAVN